MKIMDESKRKYRFPDNLQWFGMQNPAKIKNYFLCGARCRTSLGVSVQVFYLSVKFMA